MILGKSKRAEKLERNAKSYRQVINYFQSAEGNSVSLQALTESVGVTPEFVFGSLPRLSKDLHSWAYISSPKKIFVRVAT